MQILQEDPARLTEWSKDWLLQFNADKCKLVHLGKARNSEQMAYNLRTDQGRQDLETVPKDKDLNVIVTNDLKPSLLCAEAARKATNAEVNKRFLQVSHQGKFHHPI